ncbi:hypothetical protein MLD38_024979 [Melastoma candidum]|uniref:Uncharacterized protein n=1 Tax=Melastoma candidum TaxID=119954 RepID=A0ACB9NUX2_9MYRT|nr:hypothetical protein MLD38_024979 [Melastoma candidum]
MEQIEGLTGNPILTVLAALFTIVPIIKLQHYCAQFLCLLVNCVVREESRVGGDVDRLLEGEKGNETSPSSGREDFDEVDLSRSEVRMVMERLGMFGSEYAQEGQDHRFSSMVSGGGIGAGEIARLFEEEEVCLEEVKEAFYVFDGNCDGRIDPGELSGVIRALGMANLGESDCRELIRNFDEDGDGFIDFREFTKLVKKSLRS